VRCYSCDSDMTIRGHFWVCPKCNSRTERHLDGPLIGFALLQKVLEEDDE
jgi:Zn finger protein HypA/HybF involved in hydrogenase expression